MIIIEIAMIVTIACIAIAELQRLTMTHHSVPIISLFIGAIVSSTNFMMQCYEHIPALHFRRSLQRKCSVCLKLSYH